MGFEILKGWVAVRRQRRTDEINIGYFPSKTNTPSFHYSIIPWSKPKISNYDMWERLSSRDLIAAEIISYRGWKAAPTNFNYRIIS